MICKTQNIYLGFHNVNNRRTILIETKLIKISRCEEQLVNGELMLMHLSSTTMHYNRCYIQHSMLLLQAQHNLKIGMTVIMLNYLRSQHVKHELSNNTFYEHYH